MGELRSRIARIESGSRVQSLRAPLEIPTNVSGTDVSIWEVVLRAVDRLGREGARQWLVEQGIDWADQALEIVEAI